MKILSTVAAVRSLLIADKLASGLVAHTDLSSHTIWKHRKMESENSRWDASAVSSHA